MQQTKRLSGVSVVDCYDIPEQIDPASVYQLLPKNPDEKYYWERVDRNLGWITRQEQELLRHKVVGIAGCGGMGGLIAATLLRLGVGEIRIADSEVFDVSNINRQLAATRHTAGKSKAMETACGLREISDDSTIVVYPQGIREKTAAHFVEGCDIISDEIEFWELWACILLHRHARSLNVPFINALTVGFGIRLFYFTPTSTPVEELLGISLEEAIELKQRLVSRPPDQAAVKQVVQSALRLFVPEIPRYCLGDYDDREARLKRLREEGRASIIATNPPFAAGFTADRILFQLLEDLGVKRNIVPLPEAPDYLYLDAATMQAKVITGKNQKEGG